jgi:hypothetical protein
MRRDASVCPHCRRDSEPWRFWEGRWWAYSASGDDVWYDEVLGVWRTPDATSPADRGGGYDLVVTAIPDPKAVGRIARIAAEESPKSHEQIHSDLQHLPLVVVERIGYATVEGLRLAMVRNGAEVDVRPHATAPLTPPPRDLGSSQP